MTREKTLDGKPYVGNPHVRSDEGEVALATLKRGSLLCLARRLCLMNRETVVTLAFVATTVLAVTAKSATVTLNQNSMKGFTTKEGWSSGNPPEAGNDYVVADGHYLHGDYSEGFA